jgi:RNA polymerase sigma-70 factor (ECF subfamily)
VGSGPHRPGDVVELHRRKLWALLVETRGDLLEVARQAVVVVFHVPLYEWRGHFLIGNAPAVQDDRLDALFDDHAQGLFGFLVYRTGSEALAEEVVADTFERAVRSHRRFDPQRGSEKTWLYSIALNRLKDLRRKATLDRRALEEAGTESAAGPDPFEDRIAQRSELRVALAKLSDEEREALALRYGGGMTAPEVARTLGEPLPRVEGRIYRGLRKLRAELEDPGAGDATGG